MISSHRRRWDVVESLCRRIDAKLMAELGVLRCAVTSRLLSRMPELTVIGVDTWMHGIPEFEPDQSEKKTPADNGYRAYADVDMEQAYADALALAEEHAPRFHVWRMDQMAAAERIEPDSLDLVFQDADHTTDALRLAIKAWLPAVRPGGIVSGHDYDMPSVRAALDELCPTFRADADSVWWAYREEVAL